MASRSAIRWVVGSLASALVLVASGALASPFGGPYARNSYQPYYYSEGLATRFRDATNWNRNQNLNPTDINTATTSNHDAAMVHVSSYVFGDSLSNYYGIVRCKNYDSMNNMCTHSHLNYNEGKRFPGGGDRVLACHESGHTIGFDDYSGNASTCTDESNDYTKPAHFNSHEIRDHINVRY